MERNASVPLLLLILPTSALIAVGCMSSLSRLPVLLPHICVSVVVAWLACPHYCRRRGVRISLLSLCSAQHYTKKEARCGSASAVSASCACVLKFIVLLPSWSKCRMSAFCLLCRYPRLFRTNNEYIRKEDRDRQGRGYSPVACRILHGIRQGLLQLQVHALYH